MAEEYSHFDGVASRLTGFVLRLVLRVYSPVSRCVATLRVLCDDVVTVPYILETADGDSDLSYEQLLQLTSSASTGVIAGRGKSHRA